MLPFLPFLLSLFDLIDILPSFGLIATFSLYPLLLREDQILTYISSIVGYFVVCVGLLDLMKNEKVEDKNNKKRRCVSFFTLLNWINVILVIIYHVLDLCIKPPPNLPWLFPLINAGISFVNFGLFYVYANYIMIFNNLEDDEKHTQMVKEKLN